RGQAGAGAGDRGAAGAVHRAAGDAGRSISRRHPADRAPAESVGGCRARYRRRRLAQRSTAGASSRASPPPVVLRAGAAMLQPSSSLERNPPPVAVRAGEVVGEIAPVAVRAAEVVGEAVADPRLGVTVGVVPGDPLGVVGVTVAAPDVLVGVWAGGALGVTVGV